MHMKQDDLPKLCDLFKQKYNRDLVGSDMGQFHVDFSNDELKSEKPENPNNHLNNSDVQNKKSRAPNDPRAKKSTPAIKETSFSLPPSDNQTLAAPPTSNDSTNHNNPDLS